MNAALRKNSRKFRREVYDIDNLLIVCPNHHRIIHAANPTFDRQQKIYIYPNGYAEGLKLNLHL